MDGRAAGVHRPPGHVLPDTFWCWLVVVGNVVIGITSLGFFRTLPVFFRSFMMEYDVEYAAVASIAGLFTFGMALGCLLLSFLTRKFGRQRVCIAAGFLLGSANAVSSFTYSFVVLQICTGFLSGLSTGILTFTMMYSSSQYFVKHRAKATGISTLGIPLGPLILAPAVDRLIDTFGWRGALLIASGILLNSCVSASLYRPVVLIEPVRRKSSARRSSERKSHQKSISEMKNTGDQIPMVHRNSNEVFTSDIPRKKSFCSVVKKKLASAVDYRLFMSVSYDVGLLSSIFYFSGYITANTFLVPLARDYIGLSSFQASTVLSIVSAAECISKVITGYMADIKKVDKCILLAVMAAFCSMTIVAMSMCGSYVSLCIAAFIYGLFVTAYMGIIVVIFCDIVGPHKIATAVGYQGAIYNCFVSLCLLSMGRLVDATNDARRTFYTGAGLVCLAGLCLLVIYWLQWRKRRLQARDVEAKVING